MGRKRFFDCKIKIGLLGAVQVQLTYTATIIGCLRTMGANSTKSRIKIELRKDVVKVYNG
jgi:hypothetical protein